MLLVPLLLAALGAASAIGDDDLRPFFEASRLQAAKQAFDAERWEEAVRGFGENGSPEARYLRAIALVSARRGEEAATALAGLPTALPAIADRVHWWTGLALDGAGRRLEAAEAYARVPEGSVLFAESCLARARALHAAGEGAAALAALAPALALPAPPDLSRADAVAGALLLGGQLRAAGREPGDLAEARRELLDCWALHPLAPESRECLSRLEALPPPHAAPPSAGDALRRAEALLELNRNRAALAELSRPGRRLPAAGPGDPLGCRAAFVRGKALRKEREYALAVQALGPVVERCGDPALRPRALYVLAAAAANSRSPGEAVGHYRTLAREYPDHPLADDALLFSADLLARDGKVDEARQALSELVAGYPKGDVRPEALFRLAWLLKREGEVEQALASLSRIEAEYHQTEPYEHARAAYWRARFLAARGAPGDAALAREAWAQLAARYPADYYGLLSRARLEERGESGPAPAAPADPGPARFRYAAGPLLADVHFQAGLLLLRLGLPRAAADELNAVDRRLLADAGFDPLLLLAELLDRAGDHRSAHNLMRVQGRQALRQAPLGENLRVWRMAYPPAFRVEVERWAAPAGVPPELLQALMREESALDPTAVSPAGAVGLTQLMLPTAQELARRLRLPRPAQADLMNASLNIRLGAALMGDLLRRYGGSAPLALAAYNAGDTAVLPWWRARAALDLDEFVEEIPLQETRGYVKRVLRSYAAYRFLDGKPAEAGSLFAQKLPPPR